MANRQNLKLHAIMVSFHLQGHIIPFVNLALKLASKGFSVTFAHLHFIHHRITGSDSDSEIDIFAGCRSSGLDISYTTFSDGFPVEFDRDGNLDLYLEFFVHKFPDKVDQLVGEIIQSKSESGSVSGFFLVSDTFSIWLPEIAKKYNLLNVSFWTEAALVFALYYHRRILTENGHVPVNGRREKVEYIPGVHSINTKDFMSYFHDSELQMLHNVMFEAFDRVKSADFILCNTVEEIETDVISALREELPFYAVGPLFQMGTSIATNLLPEIDPAEWLKSKAPSSVLYISFGSLAKVNKKVIFEIAGGLLLAGINFIWVMRPGMADPVDGANLPENFVESTRDRGLIVPWCTQIPVLKNPAIGGFMTHCGWNSVLESVWCGIPMICYPLFTDQITNRKLVVDDWEVGINLCEGDVISKEEVAEKIVKLMNGETAARRLKKGIREKREMLQRAVAAEGSSEINFESFASNVYDEFLKRRNM